jgi:hypothetical protein
MIRDKPGLAGLWRSRFSRVGYMDLETKAGADAYA